MNETRRLTSPHLGQRGSLRHGRLSNSHHPHLTFGATGHFHEPQTPRVSTLVCDPAVTMCANGVVRARMHQPPRCMASAQEPMSKVARIGVPNDGAWAA